MRMGLMITWVITVTVVLLAPASAQVSNPTFSPPVSYEIPGTFPGGPTVDDLNGDGHLDIVFAAEEAAIMFGDGTGGFQDDSFTVVQMAYDNPPASVCSGDFNGDGARDLAFPLGGTLNGLGQYNHKVEVFLGDGGGGWTHSTTLTAGVYPISCAVGDFDEDGDDDLAVVANQGNIDVFPGLGNGQFGSPTSLQGPNPPSNGVAITTMDLDADGHLDLLAIYAGLFPHGIIYWGDGTGVYSTVNSYQISPARSLTVTDFDGDGLLDLVGTVEDHLPNWVGGLRRFRNLGNRTFQFQGPTPAPVAAPGTGDFNGDGAVDLMFAVAGGIQFFAGAGDGSFTAGATIATPLGGGSIATSVIPGDWNEDGLIDVAYVDANLGNTPYLYALDNVTSPGPWTFLGHGLEGSSGLPLLTGQGTLMGGTAGAIHLAHALPGSPVGLVVGANRIDFPLAGGLLVPSPDVIVQGQLVNPAGEASWTFTWPPGIAPGLVFYAQAWLYDSAGPIGYAASNGLRGVTP